MPIEIPAIVNQTLNRRGTVLLLADRRQSQTGNALRTAGYHLLTAFTPDHAVALCVNNNVDAVILDQEHFVVTEGWSVAQSLKMIKAHICVLLVIREKIVNDELPAGIDAMIPQGDARRLLKTLKELF
ncbi:MAG TPA: hypothetical protein VKD65_04840 [Candidatus Angelobacter sp.]|nr:hypothetical protein [Candidatus Angelobacter sp.]